MQQSLLNNEIRTQVAELFDCELINPIELVFFSSDGECEACDTTQQLLEEISAISNLVTLSVHDIDEEAQLAEEYHVELAPGLAITGLDNGIRVDYGIRFLGIPSGYEFSSLMHAIVLVSKRESGLKSEIRNELKAITTPIHLKVFVTPT